MIPQGLIMFLKQNSCRVPLSFCNSKRCMELGTTRVCHDHIIFSAPVVCDLIDAVQQHGDFEPQVSI